MKPDFQFFQPKFFLLQVKVKKISIFGKKYFSVGRYSIIRIIKRKLKFGFITLCVIQCRFQNCPCFFFLASIVFDFYSFEISKINNQKNIKILIFSKSIPKIKKFHEQKVFFFNFTYVVLISPGSVHK